MNKHLRFDMITVGTTFTSDAVGPATYKKISARKAVATHRADTRHSIQMFSFRVPAHTTVTVPDSTSF